MEPQTEIAALKRDLPEPSDGCQQQQRDLMTSPATITPFAEQAASRGSPPLLGRHPESSDDKLGPT